MELFRDNRAAPSPSKAQTESAEAHVEIGVDRRIISARDPQRQAGWVGGWMGEGAGADPGCWSGGLVQVVGALEGEPHATPSPVGPSPPSEALTGLAEDIEELHQVQVAVQREGAQVLLPSRR